MPVSDTANATTPLGAVSCSFAKRSPVGPAPIVQRHAAVVGELERVREQVLEHLLRAAARRSSIVGGTFAPLTSTSNSSPFCSATGRNVRSTKLAQVARAGRRRRATSIFPASTFERSRMSLIRSSRSRARRVDRLRELDLLLVQVAVRVVGEQLREDQQRVERRAQLVRHVREELALVLRRERELLGLLLERRPRELDLAGS